MTIKELTKGQLRELKVNYLEELLQKEENRGCSYGEIISIDDIIADDDKDFIEKYEIYDFVNDDFFTNDRKEDE